GIPAIPKVPNPFSNLPGGSLGHPSLPGVPSIPSLASSVPGVPSIPPTAGQPTLPIIIVGLAGAAAVLFIFRKRLGMLGRRTTSTTLKTKPVKPGTGLNLQNPRDLIIYYCRKAVATMSKRGFPRLDPETHRELSEKCSPRPEPPPVTNISVLYEKTMFIGLGLVLATVLLRRRGRKWEKIKPLMTEQRPMRLRQFISLLWLVALVAILFAPSVRFGLGGGSTPLAVSFHAIQPYLAHLE